MLACPQCTSLIPDTREKCLTCGHNAGPPNVRAANTEDEVRALEERYQDALDSARQKGCLPVVEKLFDAVEKSSAVINVDAWFLDFFAMNPTALYTNYEKAVAGNARKPATLENDAARRVAGSTLFGEYAGEIIYGALSLTGLGPHSYGPCVMTLKEITINQRTTVLENNSYDFVRKHQLLLGKKRPIGYLASWSSRSKLAVAKLEPYITSQTTEADLHQLLLSTAGNRATDEFLEVHIYGPFDLAAIESVRVNSKAASRQDRSHLRMAKPHLKRAGISWIDHD